MQKNFIKTQSDGTFIVIKPEKETRGIIHVNIFDKSRRNFEKNRASNTKRVEAFYISFFLPYTRKSQSENRHFISVRKKGSCKVTQNHRTKFRSLFLQVDFEFRDKHLEEKVFFFFEKPSE